jgi:N-carbamoylputrescine amidase
MKQRIVRVALIQMSCKGTSAQNLKKAVSRVAAAARRGAQIVCLPELFLGPYFCQAKRERKAFETAEPIPGPTTRALAAIAKKYRIVLIGGSLFEKNRSGKYFNTAPVFGPNGKRLGLHRKIHIPEDALFHEQQYFERSSEGIKVFKTPFGNISVLICFDQWFPEAARIATLKGAEIIFYPTAIGTIDDAVEENITGDWEKMWRNAQLGHSAVNNVFVAAVNRVGRERSLKFWGGSFVADPSSRLLAYAGPKERIILADCDLSRVRALQDAWGFLRNRRPDAYGQLVKPVR